MSSHLVAYRSPQRIELWLPQLDWQTLQNPPELTCRRSDSIWHQCKSTSSHHQSQPPRQAQPHRSSTALSIAFWDFQDFCNCLICALRTARKRSYYAERVKARD